MSRRYRQHAPRGFSLVELVIVVLILGIMAAIAWPKFIDATNSYQLRAAAQRIAADLEYARESAKTTATPRTVTFSPSGNSYQLAGLYDLDHTSNAYAVDLDETPYPAMIVSASFGASQQLTFSVHGVPDNGGSVTLMKDYNTLTVMVDGGSGTVSVQ